MIEAAKAAIAWCVLAGHFLFGYWVKTKVTDANDVEAIRSGSRRAQRAVSNKEELVEALKKDKL